jgi:hypothetical protein
MKSFKEKVPVFLLGLMFGVLIAGSFFILKLDDYLKDLSVYKTITNSFGDKPSEVKELSRTPARSTKPSKKNKHKQIVLESVDTIPSKPSRVNKTVPVDTMGMLSTDSIGSSQENIIVKKDELISTITLEINNVSPASSRAAKDSLLQKVSGIRDDRNAGKQMINVEFWRSPLNYKGYKLSKYKMVLYGIPGSEGIKIYRLDDVIYLKYNSFIYRLDYVSEFKPYERITDENITSKLR